MATQNLFRDDPAPEGVRYEIESWGDDDSESHSVYALDRERALEVAWKRATYHHPRQYVMVYERDGDAAAHPIARYL